MNKIIEGKRYDTDTARFIAESDEVYGHKTELYRKKTASFLCCIGPVGTPKKT